MTTIEPVRFVPERVEGIDDVVEAAVYSDRLVLKSSNEERTYRYAKSLQPFSPVWILYWLIRFLGRIGIHVDVAGRIGECDWIVQPAFMAFDTSPPIRLMFPRGMSVTERERLFQQVQRVLAASGLRLTDLRA